MFGRTKRKCKYALSNRFERWSKVSFTELNKGGRGGSSAMAGMRERLSLDVIQVRSNVQTGGKFIQIRGVRQEQWLAEKLQQQVKRFETCCDFCLLTGCSRVLGKSARHDQNCDLVTYTHYLFKKFINKCRHDSITNIYSNIFKTKKKDLIN